MRKPTTRQMSDGHESFLAQLFQGRRTRGSGNQANDQMDGRNHPTEPFAFAWDGKSTLARSVGVTLEMWEKAVEQAGGEIPMLALRWYDDYRLKSIRDLVVLDARQFAEILEAARTYERVKECLRYHMRTPESGGMCVRCGTGVQEYDERK